MLVDNSTISVCRRCKASTSPIGSIYGLCKKCNRDQDEWMRLADRRVDTFEMTNIFRFIKPKSFRSVRSGGGGDP